MPARPWWLHASQPVPMSYTASFWDFHMRYLDAMKSRGFRP